MKSLPTRSFGFLNRAPLVAILLASLLLVSEAFAQDPEHPLKPADRSSPRAALKSFLEAGDAVGSFLSREYWVSASREKFWQLVALGNVTMQALDLREMAPAAREKGGRFAALALYDTLNRIQLPPWDEIPGGDPAKGGNDTNVVRWVIPNTEIALERVMSGPGTGNYLFTPATVEQAEKFYERVAARPVVRPVPHDNLRVVVTGNGGWWIPPRWIQALPTWLRDPAAGQAMWKWFATVLVLSVLVGLVRGVFLWSHRVKPAAPFLQAVAQLTLPVFVLLAAPVTGYVLLLQVNLTGHPAVVASVITTAVIYLASAWIAWRVAPVVAEAIIASPRIGSESIDAHLIRISTRLLGIAGAAVLLSIGADRMGLPVYGIVAGLGVGGLAIALAAQPTIENLIGGLSLFADKSLRVGDYCRCGSDEGTVEAIGIRSTWIRGIDRTLTTIPNSALSKMPVVNFGRRDETMIQTIVGVRYETSPDQLRHLLVKIRELLSSHPMIRMESARVRLIGFGASSLDIEVFAYVETRDRVEFMAVREDILLRIMDLVKESGTGFAFPSQTLYLGRDDGLDAARAQTAEAAVKQWRESGTLPSTNR